MKSLLFFGVFLSISVFLLQAQKDKFKSVDEVKGLQVGVVAPLFTSVDQDKKFFNLEKTLKKGPVVLVFYRGHWCPVCNRHLEKLQDSLHLIISKGASLVAISPEKPEYGKIMKNKTKVKFSLLYDEGYKIADAYDVNFLPDRTTLFFYNAGLGSKFKDSRTDDSDRLPIPATYIIDRNGIIVWRHFNPNYKKRATVQEILNNIP